MLVLCEDALCVVNLDTPSIHFTENPAKKTEFGFPTATLNVDTTNSDLYQEFYIGGSTLDEDNVFNILKGIVVVCGDTFAFTSNDPDDNLVTQLSAPLMGVKIVNLLALFSFATPNSVFPTEACLKSFTLCDDIECGLEDNYVSTLILDGYDLLIRLDAPKSPLNAYVGV